MRPYTPELAELLHEGRTDVAVRLDIFGGDHTTIVLTDCPAIQSGRHTGGVDYSAVQISGNGDSWTEDVAPQGVKDGAGNVYALRAYGSGFGNRYVDLRRVSPGESSSTSIYSKMAYFMASPPTPSYWFLDTPVGLVLDGDERIHMFCWTGTNGDQDDNKVLHAIYDGTSTTWALVSSTTVDSSAWIPPPACDAEGNIHCFYGDNTGILYDYKWNGSSWVLVDNTNLGYSTYYSRVVFDRSGDKHVCTYESACWWWQRQSFVTGEWKASAVKIVDGAVGDFEGTVSSLLWGYSVDSSGDGVLAFKTAPWQQSDRVYVTSGRDSTWITPEIVYQGSVTYNVIRRPCVSTDETGAVHIVFSEHIADVAGNNSANSLYSIRYAPGSSASEALAYDYAGGQNDWWNLPGMCGAIWPTKARIEEGFLGVLHLAPASALVSPSIFIFGYHVQDYMVIHNIIEYGNLENGVTEEGVPLEMSFHPRVSVPDRAMQRLLSDTNLRGVRVDLVFQRYGNLDPNVAPYATFYYDMAENVSDTEMELSMTCGTKKVGERKVPRHRITAGAYPNADERIKGALYIQIVIGDSVPNVPLHNIDEDENLYLVSWGQCFAVNRVYKRLAENSDSARKLGSFTTGLTWEESYTTSFSVPRPITVKTVGATGDDSTQLSIDYMNMDSEAKNVSVTIPGEADAGSYWPVNLGSDDGVKRVTSVSVSAGGNNGDTFALYVAEYEIISSTTYEVNTKTPFAGEAEGWLTTITFDNDPGHDVFAEVSGVLLDGVIIERLGHLFVWVWDYLGRQTSELNLSTLNQSNRWDAKLKMVIGQDGRRKLDELMRDIAADFQMRDTGGFFWSLDNKLNVRLLPPANEMDEIKEADAPLGQVKWSESGEIVNQATVRYGRGAINTTFSGVTDLESSAHARIFGFDEAHLVDWDVLLTENTEFIKELFRRIVMFRGVGGIGVEVNDLHRRFLMLDPLDYVKIWHWVGIGPDRPEGSYFPLGYGFRMGDINPWTDDYYMMGDTIGAGGADGWMGVRAEIRSILINVDSLTFGLKGKVIGAGGRAWAERLTSFSL